MNIETTHTIWFTGLSRSGKTSLAEYLAKTLRSDGFKVEILDGKLVRDELGEIFGFSKDERLKVNRVLCMMAKHLARHDIVPIVTAITPHEESRVYNRHELKQYIEIYIECSVEKCTERDDEGLYKKALRGDLKHFVGVDDPYEVPRKCDLKICTTNESIVTSSSSLIEFVRNALLKSNG